MGFFLYDWNKFDHEMKYKKHLIFLILLLLFLSGCDRPRLTGVEFEEIDTSKDQLQIPRASLEPIIKEFKNGRFTITPVAAYKLSGMVVGKKSYSDDWDGKISPVDLAVVWVKLVEPEQGRYIAFSQSSRWYHYKLNRPNTAIWTPIFTGMTPFYENIRLSRVIKGFLGWEDGIIDGCGSLSYREGIGPRA